MIFVYDIDNKQLANENSILSNTNDRNYNEELYKSEIIPEKSRFTDAENTLLLLQKLFHLNLLIMIMIMIIL